MTYEENRYWKNVLTVVPIVGAALATLSYGLRVFSRRFTTTGLKLEDLLMGIGLLISYCATAFVVYSECSCERDSGSVTDMSTHPAAFNGVGISVKALPPDERHRIQFVQILSIRRSYPDLLTICSV